MQLSTEQILEIANRHGATHVREVDPQDITTEQCYRDACSSNACGSYGKYWTCPPGIGDHETKIAEMSSFQHVFVIQNITELEDSWDFEGMGEAAVQNQAVVRAIAADIRENFPELRVKAMGNGGCGLCESCSYPDEPCRHPDEATPAIEGLGVNVKAMVESVGLKYINGQNTVSFVGMVLVG